MSVRRTALLAATILSIFVMAACGRAGSSGDRPGAASPGTGAGVQAQGDSTRGIPEGAPAGATRAAEPAAPRDLPTQEQQPAEVAQPAPTEPPADAPTEPPSAEPTQPDPPEQPTEAVFEARSGSADSLKGAWSQAYQMPPGVPFSVTTTEAEVEAMINEKMSASGYGDKISNLNVTLDNGQIVVSFTLTISQQVGPKTVNVSADGAVVFAASIDSSGQLALAIVSADFGKVSIPPEMLAPLSEAISQSITGAAAGSQASVTLTSLVIENGEMTVKGTVTK